MGCSMGGYGALKLALSMPDRFGFCGAISSACIYFKPILESLRTDAASYMKTGAEAVEVVKDMRAIFGDDLKYQPEGDIMELVKNFPANMPRPKIYAACGTEDNLHKENLKFREEMQKTAFDFTFGEWQGCHDWYFFSDALKKALELWYNGN